MPVSYMFPFAALQHDTAHEDRWVKVYARAAVDTLLHTDLAIRASPTYRTLPLITDKAFLSGAGDICTAPSSGRAISKIR
jgi:hypothetical protein